MTTPNNEEAKPPEKNEQVKLINRTNSGEEFRLQYQISANQVRLLKEQQWRISHYAILLFIAIWGVFTILKPDDGDISSAHTIVLITLLIVILLATLAILLKLQCSLIQSRRESNTCWDNFTPTFKRYIGASSVDFCHDLSVLAVLFGAILIGFGLDVWLIVIN